MQPSTKDSSDSSEMRNGLQEACTQITYGLAPPDEVVSRHPLTLDDTDPFVPYCYLEYIPRRRHLHRAPAAVMLDLYARAAAEVFTAGSRVACIHAAKLYAGTGYQRLGYRSAAAYAVEQLGVSGRVFRDMARLGERLDGLPATRRAFLFRELSWTQAQVIAGIATLQDEAEWVSRARNMTVRALKAEARKTREATEVADGTDGAEVTDGESTSAAENTTEGKNTSAMENATAQENAADGGLIETDSEDPASEPRTRVALRLPDWMVGKLDAVLELASQVAGVNLPIGTRLEYIAAELLSGAASIAGPDDEPGDPDESPDTGGPRPESALGATCAGQNAPEEHGSPEATSLPGQAFPPEPACSPEPASPPEDRHGYREFLENESDCWRFLPKARSPLRLEGSWAALVDECTALSKNGDAAGNERKAGITDDVGDQDDAPAQEVLTEQALLRSHRQLKRALRMERGVAWQLGRLLRTIHNRRLWHDMMFLNFSHYVSERLGISSRVAQRLIRVDRQCWSHPRLAHAYQSGELSLLKSEMVLRVFRQSTFDDRAERAWVEYAKASTFQHLSQAVRWAERYCARTSSSWDAPACMPPADDEELTPRVDSVEQSGGMPGPAPTSDPGTLADESTEAVSGNAPMFVSPEGGLSAETNSPIFGGSGSEGLGLGDSPMFVSGLRPYPATWVDQSATQARPVWLTEGEKEVLDSAIAVVRRIRGSKWPYWACLNDLLDHFLSVYDSEEFKALRRRYPLLERDGWQCRVPGCGARGALHLHHIVFRSQGGGDEPENLATLCDFHHQSLHRGWIRCIGQAPHRLYWELGVFRGTEQEATDARRGDSADLPTVAIDRILGHRRLRDDEWWDGFRIRTDGDLADPRVV